MYTGPEGFVLDEQLSHKEKCKNTHRNGEDYIIWKNIYLL